VAMNISDGFFDPFKVIRRIVSVDRHKAASNSF
jgi:hypothetical protein